MKKVVLSLILVYILMALYSLAFNVDLSIMNLLNGLKNANWVDFPTEEIQEIKDSFKEAANISMSWDDIIKVWKLFKKLSKIIQNGFGCFYSLINFLQALIMYFFGNIVEAIQIIGNIFKPNL